MWANAVADELESDEILALFKARREAKAAAAHGQDPSTRGESPTRAAPPAPIVPRPPSPAEAQPPPSKTPPASSAADAAPVPSRSMPTPSDISAPSAPPPVPVAHRETSSDRALAPAWPPAGAVAPVRAGTGAGQSLTASSPVLNLSDRLLSDANVSGRGWSPGRVLGLALTALGLAILVLERRYSMLAKAPYLVAGFRASYVALALAGLGLSLTLLFSFVPPRRHLRLRLAASQKEEWERIQKEAKAARNLVIYGATALVLGMLVLVAAYSVVPAKLLTLCLALGVVVAAIGLVTALVALARRGAIRRLYVQTLVLARLESTGLGPAAASDPRLRPVLKSLDQLLGALPESAVRRFLASDEAQHYLDLIDESSEERDG